MTKAIRIAMMALLVSCGCHGPKAPEAMVSAAPTEAATPKAPDTAARPAQFQPAEGTRTWNFDADQDGAIPAGFSFGRTGSGAPGRWVVRTEADAPSAPKVLAQLDADDTDNRFPVAVVDGLSLQDLRLSVRCKPVSGSVDQACGLVFRYLDENNYYVTRANALEGNIRLYHVHEGRRSQIAGFSGSVTAGVWHDYAIEVRGDHIQVFWDDAKVLDHHDATFRKAGTAGVWTKADSVSYFDDLSVTPMAPRAGQ